MMVSRKKEVMPNLKKTCDVYVFNTDGTVTTTKDREKPGLSELQKMVDGLIEGVHHASLQKRKGVDVWVNEEGMLMGLNRNRAAGKVLCVDLVGPVVVVDNRSDRSVSPFNCPV